MVEYRLIIDEQTIDKYCEYYFDVHKRAKKRPISNPYHESINVWMIMKRPMMNSLKQRWKDFIVWFIHNQGYDNLHIDKCELEFFTYYKSNLRHDPDNSNPKFIIDGLVESGAIIDDDYRHIHKITLVCGVDKERPRTEITIRVLDELKENSSNG